MKRYEFDRSPTEKLVVEESEYKGHPFVSLRIYYMSGEDEWLPTKKGVTFKREQLDDIIKALQQIKG